MDQQACVDKAVRPLSQAANGGARIVVFPEAFIPGTAHLDRLETGLGWR